MTHLTSIYTCQELGFQTAGYIGPLKIYAADVHAGDETEYCSLLEVGYLSMMQILDGSSIEVITKRTYKLNLTKLTDETQPGNKKCK